MKKSVLLKWDEVEDRPIVHPNDLAELRQQLSDHRWHKYGEILRRSDKEHKQFFAVLAEAWAQYPEDLKDPICKLYEDPESQREKFRAESLIDCGFYTEREAPPCSSERQAIRWAGWFSKDAPFSRVIQDGPFIKIRLPKSMAIDETGKAGMTRKEFQRAKRALFEHWASAIGVFVDDLVRQSELKKHADD